MKEKLEIYFDVTFEREECKFLIELLKGNEDFLDGEDDLTAVVALRRKLEECCFGYTSD